jgi:hypothetical protein
MYEHFWDIVIHKWNAIVIDDLVEYAKLCNDTLTNEVCHSNTHEESWAASASSFTMSFPFS